MAAWINRFLVEHHEIQRDMSSVTNNYHSLFLYIDLFLYELKWNEQWVPVFVAVRWCTVEYWWILIRGLSWRSAFSERRVQWKLGPLLIMPIEVKPLCWFRVNILEFANLGYQSWNFQRCFYWGKSYRMMSMKYPVWLCHEVLTAFFTAWIWRNCDCPTERRLNPPM